MASDRVLSVATTHYERLKTLAIAGDDETRTHFRNASVALDEEGRPTFALRLDEVGGSSALDAAKRHEDHLAQLPFETHSVYSENQIVFDHNEG